MPPNPAGQSPATPSTTAPAGSRENRSGILLPPRRVAREFTRLFRERGMAVHPAEVRQLATRFVADGHERLEDAEAWFISYADPTGETAARHVDRERGAHR